MEKIEVPQSLAEMKSTGNPRCWHRDSEVVAAPSGMVVSTKKLAMAVPQVAGDA